MAFLLHIAIKHSNSFFDGICNTPRNFVFDLCFDAGNSTTDEINTCRRFFAATLVNFRRLSAIIALGKIAHDQMLKTLRIPLARHKFAHGAVHNLECLPGIRLYDSYHCSRYNTNTGVLTPDMFRAVFAAVRRDLDAR